MSDQRCRYHAASLAVAQCSRCGSPICWLCTRSGPQGFVCPQCLQQQSAAPQAQAEPQPQASPEEAAAGAPEAEPGPTPPPPPPYQPPVGANGRPHNPAVALVLSCIPGLVGAGQMYNRQVVKGFVILLAWWMLIAGQIFSEIGVFFAMAMWVWAAADAYFTAKDIRAGQVVPDLTLLNPKVISERLQSEGVTDRVSEELGNVGARVQEEVGRVTARMREEFRGEFRSEFRSRPAPVPPPRPKPVRPTSPVWGLFLILLGALLTLNNYDIYWMRDELIWPSVFLGIGIILLGVYFWPGHAARPRPAPAAAADANDPRPTGGSSDAA